MASPDQKTNTSRKRGLLRLQERLGLSRRGQVTTLTRFCSHSRAAVVVDKLFSSRAVHRTIHRLSDVEVHLLLRLMYPLTCEGNVTQQVRQQPPWNVCSDVELPATDFELPATMILHLSNYGQKKVHE
jgi:hypothetical protein